MYRSQNVGTATKYSIRQLAQDYNELPNKPRSSISSKSICVKYGLLHRLPYFDVVNGLCVDPMYCLSLGISKIIVKQFVETGALSSIQLDSMMEYKSRGHMVINYEMLFAKDLQA